MTENLCVVCVYSSVSWIELDEINIFVISAPAPSNVQTVIGTKCIRPKKDVENNVSRFYIPRPNKAENGCFSVKELDDPYIKKNKVQANQIVFAFQIPLPKHDINLDFSRWQQTLISVIQLDVVHDKRSEMGMFSLHCQPA